MSKPSQADRQLVQLAPERIGSMFSETSQGVPVPFGGLSADVRLPLSGGSLCWLLTELMN
jgi:hypothetical protein